MKALNLKLLKAKKGFSKASLLMLFLFSFFSSNAQVANGSFEADPIIPLPPPASAWFTYPPFTSMTSWTNTSSTDDLDLHHSSLVGTLGTIGMGSSNLDYHIDLNSTGEATQTGIPLTMGTNILTFDASVHVNLLTGSSANAMVELTSAAGLIFNFPFTITKTTPFNIPQGWGTTFSFPIPIPTTGVYQLKFSGTGSPYFFGGVLIDNVSLTSPCPTVAISGVSSVCAGNSAVLNANPAGLPGYTYTWSPGGATGSSMSTGPLTSPTTYTVTMTNGTCTSTATHTVNVIPATVPTFSFNTVYCNGVTIPALPTTSNNGITGTWSPALSNTVSQTYTFTPNPGQCATPYTTSIVIDQCCFDVDFCYTIDNKKLTFTSVTPGANVAPCTYRYKWIWGDGTTSPTASGSFHTTATAAKAATKTYTNEGTYNVCLVVEKLCAGTVVCCKQICKQIKTVPKCDATVINAELGLSIVNTPTGTVVTPIIASGVFRALSGTQLSINYGTPILPNYIVTTGANTFSASLAARTYTVPGIYDYCVTLTYTNALGDQCIDRRCKTIVIEPWCATQAHYKYSACAQSNSFNFTPIGNAAGATVYWDFGDGTNANSLGNAPMNKTYANSGVYQVCMSVTQGKCFSQACYYIYANTSLISNCLPAALSAPNNLEDGVNLNDVDLKEIMIPSEDGKENVSSFVYPNPTSSEINLLMHAAKSSVAKIDVISSTGKILQSRTTSVNEENSKETFDFSNLENGMYVLRVEVDGQVNIHKISVAK